MKINKFVLYGLFALITIANCAAQVPDSVIDCSSKLYDSTVVQTMDLTLSADDWALLKQNYNENTNYKGSMNWGGIAVSDVAIRSRGSSSRSGVKPSLKITIDKYVDDATFLLQKSLVLLNMVQDPPMLRDYLSMQMFRRAGIPAPRSAYVKVTVNGEFQGLFLLVEDIDTPFLARNFYTNSGWLYEYNLNNIYHFEDRGDDPAAYTPDPFELKTNKKTPNAEELAAFVQSVNRTTPEIFIDDVSPHLDINRLLRHVAVETYLAEIDGIAGVVGANNFYLYQPGAGAPFEFIPWDKSATLYYWDEGIYERLDENMILRAALQVPDLKRRYLSHLSEVTRLAGGKGGWLDRLATQAIALTRESALADPNKPYTNTEYTEALDTTVSCIRDRYTFLLDVLAAEGIQKPGTTEAGNPTQ
ncbi:CotH kinase family protein [uncultured Paludibaculum sp.]|uniref:CotH kinase family protein n=1 Tax=uncultured Paludibaculum sp. TaxID=1765020 RepID=UPI002AAB886F|nr:CotH kinase family protein [uncultured Paludibaculum sp.]